MKLNKKSKKMIVSFITLIILSTTGYYGIDYIRDENSEKDEIKITTSASIENSELVDLKNNKLNIIFFYVGQADSTLIKLNEDVMLIDAGNNEDGNKIVQFLSEQGINKIDYLIGTHADEDHIGGLDDILENINVEKLYIPTIGSEGKDYENALSIAKEKNIQVFNPVRGDTFQIDKANCEIMSAMEGEDISDNNSSLVIEMNYFNTKYLFMGDAEKEVENSRKWNDIDILKVGHHGSNSSSSEKFLTQVKPEYSIIQVGKDNSYNLPSSKALTRLKQCNTKILRTDNAIGNNVGSFWLTSEGNNIDIKEVNISLDGNI